MTKIQKYGLVLVVVTALGLFLTWQDASTPELPHDPNFVPSDGAEVPGQGHVGGSQPESTKASENSQKSPPSQVNSREGMEAKSTEGSAVEDAPEAHPDNPAMPAAAGTEETQEHTGFLEAEEIQKSAWELRSQLKECYETSLKDFPDASGKLTVEFILENEDDGTRVTQAEVLSGESTILDDQLNACLMRGLQELKIDVEIQGGESVKVRDPFRFSPEGE